MTIYRLPRPAPRMLPLAIVILLLVSRGHAAGEPAAEFLKRLRAAKYFDLAIAYLDRLDEYPGVDPDLRSAVRLEKAQTWIDAAVAARSADRRDEYFQRAEQQLGEFLKQGSHPRLSEARLQLGKLQMVRAAQLMSGEPDDAKRKAARESYMAAAETFDTIVEVLRATLKEMQGARIDPQKDPQAAARRDQYRGQFLQAMSNAGQSRHLAARTFKDPGQQGKELLQQALETFTELSDKYDTYVQGAIAMLHRGQVQHDLGNNKDAMDSYLRMMEHPDADPLRDAKYQATSGIIRLSMAQSPPNFQASIDRGQPMIDGLRPDEKMLESVQELQIELAKAYLAKSNDKDNQKPADRKRAQSEARQMLIRTSKLPGQYADQANQMLANLGIELDDVPEMPTAEDPESLEDALEKSRQLLAASENLSQTLAVLEEQKNADADVVQQKENIQQQLRETRSLAIQIMRRGLSMVTTDTDHELINQTRQYLAYLLYQQQHYRDSAVVGGFLAHHAPGTEMGLRGGLLALNSLQLLLVDQPENVGLISHLEDLGNYLTKTWPDDPDAASARGVMIKLALRNDRWEEAGRMITGMPKGPERASFQRLMGQLLWNKSIQTRADGDDAQASQLLQQAATELSAGLDGISGKLVDPEAMKAALVLAKVYLKQGEIKLAADVLDHEIYGPVKLLEQQGPPNPSFPSDLYSTQLQVIVGRMTSGDENPQSLLDRAIEVMEKLRASVQGADAQQRLTAIYMRMASNIRQQLDDADPGTKASLIEAFRVFLERISETTRDAATQQWVGQTLMDLAEVSMQPGQIKATGQAADLLKAAVETFDRIQEQVQQPTPTIEFQQGRAYRLLGNYKPAIDRFDKLLTDKPVMLDAQMEAALAYEQWAAILPPKFAAKAYESALNGARKDVIWGWGKISQMTNRDPKFKDKFFESRYHVALCRFLWGKVIKNKAVIEKSASDITKVHVLHPEMGGREQRQKFDQLLKVIQKELGQPATGLPQPQAAQT